MRLQNQVFGAVIFVLVLQEVQDQDQLPSTKTTEYKPARPRPRPKPEWSLKHSFAPIALIFCGVLQLWIVPKHNVIKFYSLFNIFMVTIRNHTL